MFKIINNELSLILVKNFTALQDLHLYHTRQTKIQFSFHILFQNQWACQNQLALHGTKFWSELNDNLDLEHLTIICFKKESFGSLLTTKFSFNHLICR